MRMQSSPMTIEMVMVINVRVVLVLNGAVFYRRSFGYQIGKLVRMEMVIGSVRVFTSVAVGATIVVVYLEMIKVIIIRVIVIIVIAAPRLFCVRKDEGVIGKCSQV